MREMLARLVWCPTDDFQCATKHVLGRSPRLGRSATFHFVSDALDKAPHKRHGVSDRGHDRGLESASHVAGEPSPRLGILFRQRRAESLNDVSLVEARRSNRRVVPGHLHGESILTATLSCDDCRPFHFASTSPLGRPITGSASLAALMQELYLIARFIASSSAIAIRTTSSVCELGTRWAWLSCNTAHAPVGRCRRRRVQ